MPPAVPLPRDTPYPGTIALSVDATDLTHRIMSVHETIPVAAPGDLILHYPEWIPGAHGPTGPIELLAGLVARAGTATLDWRPRSGRHVRLPCPGYRPVPTSIGIDFQFPLAGQSRGRDAW